MQKSQESQKGKPADVSVEHKTETSTEVKVRLFEELTQEETQLVVGAALMRTSP